jgi:hypothetical protein
MPDFSTIESKVLYTNPPQSDRSGLYKWGMEDSEDGPLQRCRFFQRVRGVGYRFESGRGSAVVAQMVERPRVIKCPRAVTCNRKVCG